MQGFTITILLITGVFMIDLFWHLKVPVYVSNSFITDGNLFLINGLIDNPVYSKDSLLQDGRFIINGLPWSMDIALISSAFFMGGYFIKGNKREGVFNQSRIAIIMLVLFSTLHIFFNDTIDLNLRRYDSLIISTLIACSAIYVCVHSSFIISNCNLILKKPLSYIGRYSLIIFIFHPIIQSKTYYAFISLYPNATHTLPFLSSFFVGMCTPLLLNWLIIERFIVFRYWYYAKTGS
jgi:fucose 4-O-acetylase-like acetyltransferase